MIQGLRREDGHGSRAQGEGRHRDGRVEGDRPGGDEGVSARGGLGHAGLSAQGIGRNRGEGAGVLRKSGGNDVRRRLRDRRRAAGEGDGAAFRPARRHGGERRRRRSLQESRRHDRRGVGPDDRRPHARHVSVRPRGGARHAGRENSRADRHDLVHLGVRVRSSGRFLLHRSIDAEDGRWRARLLRSDRRHGWHGRSRRERFSAT